MSLKHIASELLTVRDWIRWAATRLDHGPDGAGLYFGHGTDNAWDDAVALVTGWLRIPPDRVEVMLDARLTSDERETLAALVQRRLEDRVPTAYLTGRAWLAGHEFVVTSDVLIPRSPFALLIEDGFQPWLLDAEPRRILDLCTGSGCLAVLLARMWPDAEVVASDLSEAALAVAGRNVARHGLQAQIELVHADGFDPAGDDAALGEFDLIICNPPYVGAAELASVPAEFTHEPELALAGGEDGLDLVARLVREAPGHLAPQGWFACEVGNSVPAVLARWPEAEFLWPEFEEGSPGIFLAPRDLLERLDAAS